MERFGSVTAPTARYEIGGRLFGRDEPGFADAIAEAHAARQRPRCLCVDAGVEMYVARLAQGGFIVKRMPETGSRHAPHCPSYEPPADGSGLGQVLGSAIVEDPATGETTLKLDFPLTRMPGRSQVPPAGGGDGSARSDGTRLSLRGLLHYLWDQAELTRWHPGFAGKRTWATVRRHLLQAAAHKVAGGEDLRRRLYVPEPFFVADREAITARRAVQWQQTVAAPGAPQRLMLLIGELKEIVPARFGFKAVVKHVPDQAFSVDETLYRRLGRRFEEELALWASADDLHMVVIATFSVSEAGIPRLVETSLMPVTPQWVPVEDGFERQLVARLVAEERSFVKGLRFDLSGQEVIAAATLTDTGGIGMPLHIQRPGARRHETREVAESGDGGGNGGWTWQVAMQSLPALPRAEMCPEM